MCFSRKLDPDPDKYYRVVKIFTLCTRKCKGEIWLKHPVPVPRSTELLLYPPYLSASGINVNYVSNKKKHARLFFDYR
jgi:hypothetical protein